MIASCPGLRPLTSEAYIVTLVENPPAISRGSGVESRVTRRNKRPVIGPSCTDEGNEIANCADPDDDWMWQPESSVIATEASGASAAESLMGRKDAPRHAFDQGAA